MGEHPKADIRTALRKAVKDGMVVTEVHKGHRWGELRCPECARPLAIASTPRDTGTIAKRIAEYTRKHTACGKGET